MLVRDGGGKTAAHTGGAVADGGGRTAVCAGAAADGGGRTAAHTGAAGPAVVRAPFPIFRRLPFLWERLCIWAANGLSRRNLWRVDIANAGLPITRTAAFREADVVHLHWVNQGFLSLAELRRILQSGKRVVWTMHDMWPCTAICHHAGTCQHYHTHCHDCPLLVRPGRHDLAYRVFGQKQKAYRHGHIDFVTCSRWLADQARQSALLAGHDVLTIPNTYDATVFHPASQAEARAALGLPSGVPLVLFASHKVTNAQKGLDYLLRAFAHLTDRRFGLLVVGQMAEAAEQPALAEQMQSLPFDLYPIGYVTDERRMATIYQAADVFVTPSLEENLPNTIMEAMACGTPCVGFRVGGIPEMIDHRLNGYLARYKDEQDLAAGIRWALDHRAEAGQRAAEKAVATWNEDVVARQYIAVYKGQKKSHLQKRPNPQDP